MNRQLLHCKILHIVVKITKMTTSDTESMFPRTEIMKMKEFVVVEIGEKEEVENEREVVEAVTDLGLDTIKDLVLKKVQSQGEDPSPEIVVRIPEVLRLA